MTLIELKGVIYTSRGCLDLGLNFSPCHINLTILKY